MTDLYGQVHCYIAKLDQIMGWCPRGVMVKAIDSGILVNEFVLQSRYYVHFRANTRGKGINPLSSQLWAKKYLYCSSRRKALALNNLKRLIRGAFNKFPDIFVQAFKIGVDS